jgi:hypothetical protein
MTIRRPRFDDGFAPFSVAQIVATRRLRDPLDPCGAFAQDTMIAVADHHGGKASPRPSRLSAPP